MNITIDPDFEHILHKHTEEESQGLADACLEDPNHENMPPVYVWSGDGPTIIVDGHNQFKHRTALGLKIRFKELEFDDRAEAWEYAFNAQFSRRNSSPSQKAMAWSKRPKVAGGRKSSSANLQVKRADIAKKAGISERTIRSADKVRAKGVPELVAAAEADEVSVSDAAAIADQPAEVQKKAVKALRKGEATTLKAAVKEKPVEDANGLAVPEKLAAYFEQAEEFEGHAKALTKVQQWAKALDGQPVAAFFHVQSFVADLNNAKQALRFSAPFAVCPYCQAKKQNCEACHGGGFVNKTVYNAAPQEMRA